MKSPFFFIAICASLLIGCKVGPNYTPPAIWLPDTFSEDETEKTFIPEDSDLFHWWVEFNDPYLNGLLEEAITGSFDYRIAIQQVRQARAQYWTQFTQILPEIDFDATATRFRQSSAFASATPAAATASTFSPTNNFFQVGFDAIWEIDLFGKLRRAAAASYDLWQAASETARDVKIIVLSEVANTYAIICSLQQKIQIAKDIVAADESLLELVLSKFSAGLAREQDVDNVKAALETDNANLRSLTILLHQNINSLGILLGRAPETFVEDFETTHPIPIAEGRVPAGFPADLLRRRYDIRSAERQLAAATEQVGVAVAALYPSVQLTGSSSSFAANPLQGANIGFTTDEISRLFTPAARIWGIGALLVQPVFDFGKRIAGIEVQRALQEQACLTLHKTVIAALQEVENALTAYLNEEERQKNLKRATEANKNAYELTLDHFESGLGTFTEVLQTRELWLQSLNAYTDSMQALSTDLIALYKSLGGDW